MLYWLKRLFSQDARRAIFRYWDGTKWRRVDPAEIDQRMRAHADCNFDTDPRIMFKQDVFGQQAYDRVLGGIQDVFRVHRIDDVGGLTELEILGLLQAFWAFLGALKKNISLRPIVSPISAFSPSSDLPTEPNTESNSTPTAFATAAPKSC